jgi:hypothetical protein
VTNFGAISFTVWPAGAKTSRPFMGAGAGFHADQAWRQSYHELGELVARDRTPHRHYHANYYAAFVIGPDGHNIEAVCHKPEA